MSLSPAIRVGGAFGFVPLLPLLASIVLSGACEPRVDAQLLHLEGLSTERLSPGNTVRIAGRGFPPGRLGEISFDGIVHRPGEAPTPVTGSVPARAHSAGRLTFDVTPRLIEDLGGRGTFVGTLRAEFAASGKAVVSGVLSSSTLVLRPGGTGTMTRALSRERRGFEFLAHLGVRGGALDGADRGVLVESLTPGGLAAGAGVRKRDHIIGLGPMRVGDVSDLVPAASARAAELVLSRPGQSQPIRIQLPLVVRDETPTTRALLGATVASGVGLLLLLLLSPVARITARVAKALLAPRLAGEHEFLGLSGPIRASRQTTALSAMARLRQGLWLVVALAALVVAFGVLPFSARILPGAVDAGALAAMIVGLAAAVGASVPGELPLIRRVACVAHEAMVASPLLFAIGAVAIGTGTVGIEALAGAQGGAPWHWAGLASPAGLLALPAAMVSAFLAPTAPREGATARVVDGVRLFIASSLIAIVFLGAWRLPFVPGDPLLGAPSLRALAAALFVAKALAVLVVGLRLRRAFRSSLAVGFLGATLGLAAVAVAGVSLVLPALALPAEFVGPVVTAVLAVVVIVGLFHAVRPSPAASERDALALFA